MAGIIDKLYVYKFLKLLSTPWTSTPAYRLGIIDEKGNILKHYDELDTNKEKSAYSVFVRLVFKLKRMLEKIPGGKTATVRYAAALYLIREDIENCGIDFDYLLINLSEDGGAAGAAGAAGVVGGSLGTGSGLAPSGLSNVTGGIDKPVLPLRKKKGDIETRSFDTHNKGNWKIQHSEGDPALKIDTKPKGSGIEIKNKPAQKNLYIIKDKVSEEIDNELVEGRVMKIRIKNGKRVRKMEVVRKGFTRTGKRKMRGAKLMRFRRAMRRAIRRAHNGRAKMKRKRSMKRLMMFRHHGKKEGDKK